MKSKLISVNNLKVSSEHKKLVKGISFDLNRNEILGIIGESGSGKSLTALSILSLIKFKGLNQSGEIFYADELIDKNNQELASSVPPFCFQLSMKTNKEIAPECSGSSLLHFPFHFLFKTIRRLLQDYNTLSG